MPFSFPDPMNSFSLPNMALLAQDLFTKRQHLLKAGQAMAEVFDPLTAKSLEAEYRAAEQEYLAAKAAFARAMKSGRQPA